MFPFVFYGVEGANKLHKSFHLKLAYANAQK